MLLLDNTCYGYTDIFIGDGSRNEVAVTESCKILMTEKCMPKPSTKMPFEEDFKDTSQATETEMKF